MSELSLREKEVVEMVAKGFSNREIGHRLLVTEKTIKFHLTNIYQKLGVTSRAQLIVRELRDSLSKEDMDEFRKLF